MMQKIKKEKENLKEKNSKTYVVYTALFCAISIIVFLAFIKYDRSFIWSSDGIKQHFAILYDFNQMIRNMFSKGIPMLSWNMGLGLDIIGQYSYYVIGDPFAYISLLFTMDKLEIAYNFLVVLRIYFVGIAFIAYCKYTKKENFNTILGAIIYTFCGFILYAGVRHPYFTNAAIFLPLTLLGTEKLLKEDKNIFLIFVIFLSAISNYYFFYMITIINVIYGVIKYIFEYNEGLKIFFNKFGQAIICYIVGVLMASVVLLPTVYAFINSARTESIQVSTYMQDFYKFFFMGIVSMRFKNWTVIGVSSIVLLMIPVLVTKIKEKEVKSYLSLFLITTIMLLIPQIASMMNGFSFPSNRWVFAYSFILSYIVVLGFDSNLKYSKKQKIYMLIVLILYSIIGAWITKFNIKENLDYYVIGGITYLIYIIFLIKYKKEKSINIARCIIMLLVILNIFITSASLYFPRGKGYVKEFVKNEEALENCKTVNGKIKNFEEAIKYIKENDNEFYRISKKEVSYQNLSLMYDYNPIQLFLSLGNKNVYNLSCDLDDNCYSSTQCVNSSDRRTKYTTLLANKYYICDEEHTRYVPYGYSLYQKIGETLIYKNQNYLPVGIIYDSYITEEQFDKLSSLEKEDSLMSTVMIEDIEKLKDINISNSNIEIDKPISLNYTVRDNKIEDNTIKINQNNEKLELEIENIPENYELYLSINNLKYTSENNRTDFKITAKIDGITNSEKVENYISSAYYMKNPNFLMNLGITKNKQEKKLKLTFSKKGTYTFDSLKILAVSMKEYEEKVKRLKANILEDIEYGNDYIKGTVDINKDGILQLTTSYSNGWKVYVDGKETNLIKLNEAFVGTIIKEGQHTIEFKYQTPYLKLGIFCSVIGLLIFTIIILINTKRKDSVF